MAEPVYIHCRLTSGNDAGEWRVESPDGDAYVANALPSDWLPWLALDESAGQAEAWSYFRGESYALLSRSLVVRNEGGAMKTVAYGFLTGGSDDDAIVDHPEARLRKSEFLAEFRADSAAENPVLDGAAAERLIAHLFGALPRGLPVVIAAPLEDFVAPARIAQLAVFAYRALPPAWQQRCPMRIFTPDPALFLGPLRAALIAVPIQDAAKALMARRDAILLDRDANLVEGEAPPESAVLYAAEAAKVAAHGEQTLHEFARRVRVLMPDISPPSSAQLAALPVIQALSLQSPLPEIGPGASLIEWDRVLLSDSDWERLPIPMFDAIIPSRPREAIDRLLASEEWRQWREKTRCGPPARRDAAMAWCAGAVWTRGGEPLWEDWTWIAADLGPGLSAGDLEQMRSGFGFFPPICWFERDQREQLRRIADPEAQAMLNGAAVVQEVSPPPGTPDPSEDPSVTVARGADDLREEPAAEPPRGRWQRFGDWLSGLFRRKGKRETSFEDD